MENGVGMMTLMQHDFAQALKEAQLEQSPAAHRCTIATGQLAYPMMQDFAERVQQAFPQVQVQVKKIRNDFWGPTITVAADHRVRTCWRSWKGWIWAASC